MDFRHLQLPDRAMEWTEALTVADAALFKAAGRHLNDVETAILQGSWQGQTYEQIAKASGYSVSYLTRDMGPKLWKLLSQALAEPVSKTSFQAALERQAQRFSEYEATSLDHQTAAKAMAPTETGNALSEPSLAPEISPVESSLPLSGSPLKPQVDWGEVVDVGQFEGRQAERDQLHCWLELEGCRLVALLGLGGIGKSSLAAKVAHTLANEAAPGSLPPFTHIIWRSLRNAPPLDMLLTDLVLFLSHQSDSQGDLKHLLQWLRTHRCLVVLDNVETILQAGDRAGQYRPGYEDYGLLFQTLGESPHQSCVVLTSREKPAEIAAMEGGELKVKSLILTGAREVAEAILSAKGLSGSEEERQTLGDRYGDNPLALKIVASTIQELFGGAIAPFLEQDTFLFNGIRRLLAQQLERLSPTEKAILTWLAINRDWTSIAELQADLFPAVMQSDLLEALESLGWRSLIERRAGQYTLQPVVMEYISNDLIETMVAELISGDLEQFHRFALLKTTVKDYIRASQEQLVVREILDRLEQNPAIAGGVASHLKHLSASLHHSPVASSGYGAGNLLNLLALSGEDIAGADFSDLVIRHAYLAKTAVRNVNFSGANFNKTVFTQAFSGVLSVAFHPQGQQVAIGVLSGQILLWSSVRGELTQRLIGHRSWVWSVAWHPDGQELISGSADLCLKLWDAATGQCLRTFTGHQGPVFEVAWHPNGEVIASGSGDTTIKLWDAATGQCLQTLQGHTHPIHALAWSPDGTLLASASADQTLRIWAIATGECRTVLSAHQGPVWTVAWSPDGRYLASGSDDQSIHLWASDTGQVVRTLKGHTNSVWSLAWSATAQTLVSGGWDQTVKLWKVQTGECQRTIQAHRSGIWSVDLSADGQCIASGSADQTFKLWEVATGHCLQSLEGYGNVVHAVSWSPDGQKLAAIGVNQAIALWEISTRHCTQTLMGHQNLVTALTWSPEGDRLASSSWDQTVHLWDLQAGRCSQVLTQHQGPVWDVDWSPDGHCLATAGADRTVSIWEVASGRCIRVLEGFQGFVTAVAWSSDGSYLATAATDQTVRVWEAASGECVATLNGHTNAVWSVSWCPTGQYLVSGSEDQTLKIWAIASQTCVATLRGHKNAVWSVAWSPDGSKIASSSWDTTVKIWNAQHYESVCTLTGHTNAVAGLTWSPDGRLVASGSDDETVRLWDPERELCLDVLQITPLYQGTNIAQVKGLTEAQLASLQILGAATGLMLP